MLNFVVYHFSFTTEAIEMLNLAIHHYSKAETIVKKKMYYRHLMSSS